MFRLSPDNILIRNRDFRTFFSGMFLITFASQIEAVTIGWQVYTLGRATMSIEQSAFLVGMVGLAQFLPLFALTLYAGSLADRVSRRAIVLCSIAAEALGVIGLFVLALQSNPSVWSIFAIAAVFGAARAFFRPAAWALMPMLVPKPDVARAISYSSLSGEIAVITGPWIGGL